MDSLGIAGGFRVRSWGFRPNPLTLLQTRRKMPFVGAEVTPPGRSERVDGRKPRRSDRTPRGNEPKLRHGKIRSVLSGAVGRPETSPVRRRNEPRTLTRRPRGRAGGAPPTGEPPGCQAHTAGCEVGPGGTRRRAGVGSHRTGNAPTGAGTGRSELVPPGIDGRVRQAAMETFRRGRSEWARVLGATTGERRAVGLAGTRDRVASEPRGVDRRKPEGYSGLRSVFGSARSAPPAGFAA